MYVYTINLGILAPTHWISTDFWMILRVLFVTFNFLCWSTPDHINNQFSLSLTLGGGEAGAIKAARRIANVVREANYIEYT